MTTYDPATIQLCEDYIGFNRLARARDDLLGQARRALLNGLPVHASTLAERVGLASDAALVVICREVCGRPSTVVRVCPSSLCRGSGQTIDLALDDDHHGRCRVCLGRGVVALTEAEALEAMRVNDETAERALFGAAA